MFRFYPDPIVAQLQHGQVLQRTQVLDPREPIGAQKQLLQLLQRLQVLDLAQPIEAHVQISVGGTMFIMGT